MNNPPKLSKKRALANVAVTAATSAIPLFGGPAGVLLQELMTSSYRKRQDDWYELVAKGLEDLQNKYTDFKIEDLGQNEHFVDAVANATFLAIRTSDKEKLLLLRSTVLNIALGSSMDSDKTAIFQRYLGELTPSHIRILIFLDNPKSFYEANGVPWPNLMMGSVASLRQEIISDLDGDFCNLIVKDLNNSGLIANANLNVTQSGAGLATSLSSSLGKEFVNFLNDPLT